MPDDTDFQKFLKRLQTEHPDISAKDTLLDLLKSWFTAANKHGHKSPAALGLMRQIYQHSPELTQILSKLLATKSKLQELIEQNPEKYASIIQLAINKTMKEIIFRDLQPAMLISARLNQSKDKERFYILVTKISEEIWEVIELDYQCRQMLSSNQKPINPNQHQRLVYDDIDELKILC